MGRYWEAVKKKYVPLLTLDPRWHQLFPDHMKTKRMIQLEKKLNKLIKKQGQTNNDLKDYEKTRKVLMDNIINNMTDGSETDSPIRSMKQDNYQKLLDELHQKIAQAHDLQQQLPQEIHDVNHALMIESLKNCYETLVYNTQEIEQEEEWIANARKELTEHVLAKQEMEIRNTDTYRFMHDLLGADILEIFDKDYDVWKGEINREHKQV